jgi:hypothetical protein
VRLTATLGLLVSVCAAPSLVLAQAHELPQSLVAEALSELRPTAFSPAELGVEDYAVARLADGGPTTSDIRLALVPGSLDWVRVAEILLVPRGVLRVSAAGVDAGQVRYAGFSHPLVVRDGAGSVDVPVALLSGTEPAIVVETRRGTVTRAERHQLAFTPRAGRRGLVMFDSSCSPHGTRTLQGAIPDASWLYVGCRQVRTVHADHVAATLELYALWNGVGPTIEVDGTATGPTREALYTLRVAPEPSFVTLHAGHHALVLGYRAPPHLPAGFLGFGLGPYYYRYQDGPTDIEAWLPVVTLYSGYAFSPSVRVVYFNATVPDEHGSIDQGLYLWLEQARFVDERMSFNLLLGGNVLVYSRDDAVTARVSIPQGFELVFRDLFARNRNLTLGAFLYPELESRSYYNVWLRWGSPQMFGELNYIEWQEPNGNASTKSRAAGISFGAPLLRFL